MTILINGFPVKSPNNLGIPVPRPRRQSPMRRKRTLILAVAAVVAAAGTAWIALPASAAASTAAFTKTSDWGSGWQGDVTITNGGSSAMTSWKVEFDLPAGGTVGSYWDADM